MSYTLTYKPDVDDNSALRHAAYQRIFFKVVNHLMHQEGPAYEARTEESGAGACKMLTSTGRMCAVGCLLDENARLLGGNVALHTAHLQHVAKTFEVPVELDETDKPVEEREWPHLYEFLRMLQTAHDTAGAPPGLGPYAMEWPQGSRARMRLIYRLLKTADKYALPVVAYPDLWEIYQ